jgi:predicted metallopeptidase
MPYSSNGNWLAVVVTSSSTRISLAKIFGVNLVWCKTLIWNP